MPLTMERLEELCEAEKLNYFVSPKRPMLMMGFGGINGRFQVVVPLEVDGTFLQVRTVGYMHCPADHPHVDAVLAVLGHLNYKLRLIKFGWDPDDGEIVAYADIWLEDGDLTQKQFGKMVRTVITGIDLNYKRIEATIDTGEDPGEATAADLLGGALPPELRRLLEEKAGGGDDDSETEDEEKKTYEEV